MSDVEYEFLIHERSEEEELFEELQTVIKRLVLRFALVGEMKRQFTAFTLLLHVET